MPEESRVLSDTSGAPPRGLAVLFFIYFVSGICSLIDETVWVRLLKLVLGNTVYASSVVVSVFLGGLAIGAFIMARFAGRVARPLRLYAVLELAIAISALTVPVLLKVGDGLYRFLYQTGQNSSAIVTVSQVVISSLILLVPTILMGSTLPLLGEYVTARSRALGKRVGMLYAFNTLGAAVGCFAAGFLLIRWLGPVGTLVFAGGLNVCVSAAAWVLSRVSREERISEPVVVSEPMVPPGRREGVVTILLAAFFLSGLLSIAFEILWMRSIVFLLEGNTYLFAAVLTVYLLGTVAGAAVGSRLAARVACPAMAFGYTLGAFGLLGLFYVPLLNVFSRSVFPSLVGLRIAMTDSPALAAVVFPLVTCAGLFFVPSVLLGIGFPLALQAASQSANSGRTPRPGRSTGLMYGVNTVGCVIGGVLCGFVFIPMLGVEISAIALGVVGICSACAVGLASSSRRLLAVPAAAVIVVIAAIVALAMPHGQFRHLVATHAPHQNSELLYVQEGVTTTVSIHRRPEGNLWLVSSGAQVSGDESLGAHKMETHIGMLLKGHAERVLDIGFGMGETAACFIRHDVNEIDSVEISPEVLRASLAYFNHVNGGPNIIDRLNMNYMDGKNYLRLTGKTYDIVQSSPIHPKIFDSASLYTKEYFQSGLDRLAPDGVFVCWTPMHMATSCVKSIMGTFVDVFPHATLWFQTTRPESSFVLIGSRQPQRLSFVAATAEMSKTPVAESLAYLHIHDMIDLAVCYFGDEEGIRRYAEGFETNSDFSPFVEFNTEPPSDWKQVLKAFSTLARKATFPEMIDWTGVGPEERDQWLREFRRKYSACSYLISSYMQNDPGPALIHAKTGLDLVPRYAPLASQFQLAENAIFRQSSQLIRQGQAAAIDKHIAALLKLVPNSPGLWLARASSQRALGNMQEASVAAQKALALAQDSGNATVLEAVREFMPLNTSTR